MIRTALVGQSSSRLSLRSSRCVVSSTNHHRHAQKYSRRTLLRRWHHPSKSSPTSDKTSIVDTSTKVAISNKSLPPKAAESHNHQQHLMADTAKAFGIGTTAGLLGSLAGMGGGFVLIPMSTYFLRLSQHQAHGTSLFAVAATGVAGALSYGPAVQWEPAMAVALTGMVTARLGARTTTILSEKALKQALGVLMLVMSVAVPAKAHLMEQYKKEHEEASTASTSSADTEAPTLFQRLVPAAAIGTCSGYMAGLFGVGGGVIVVPALTIFTSCNHYEALATSLAAMTLPAMSGTLTHHRAGNVALRVAPALAVGALVGAAVGGQVARQTDESTLRLGFSGLLATLGIRTLLKA
eukprot:scaffold2300_cov160-Amphora_coffeaeformis.AAC.2